MNGTILVIDDSPVALILIHCALTKEGYRVIVAADGSTGLSKARKHRPDLVLLDLMMPGLNGYEVCRSLRSDPETANLPVIILTARSLPRDRELAFLAGADDYLIKPFFSSELLNRIEALLSAEERLEFAQ